MPIWTIFDTFIPRIALILRFFLQYGSYNFQIGYTFLTAHKKKMLNFLRGMDIISEIYTLLFVLITKNIPAIPELSVRLQNRGIFLD